jgi:serine/threonine protein kinase
MGESMQAWRADHPRSPENPWQEMALTHLLGSHGPQRLAGVPAFYGAFQAKSETDGGGDIFMFTEYFPGGDLFDFGSGLGNPGFIRECQVWPVIRSLLEVVSTLHARGISHGDISVENVVLRHESAGGVALIDFGAASNEDLSRVKGTCGKPLYQAPEMHLKAFYDARAADAFACGVTAYALCVGAFPWSSTSPKKCPAYSYFSRHSMREFLCKRKVSMPDGERRRISDCISQRYQMVLEKLLDPDPARRGIAAALALCRTTQAELLSGGPPCMQ